MLRGVGYDRKWMELAYCPVASFGLNGVELLGYAVTG
jgi:hypothetical protein